MCEVDQVLESVSLENNIETKGLIVQAASGSGMVTKYSRANTSTTKRQFETKNTFNCNIFSISEHTRTCSFVHGYH